jgi:RNA polymerase sigma factor (sigma-70 family)
VTNNDADEAALWERARHNDGDAFGELFDRHRGRVYGRAFGLLSNAHDADEVASAAFFELWRKRRSVRLVAGSVLPWLLVTTVNLSRNTHRSTARYQRLLRTLPQAEALPGPDAADGETRERLAESLRRLSPVDAALFVLTVSEGIPLAEAAASVGLTPATARVRLHRARARLRTDLHDLNPNTPPAIEGTLP